LSRAARLLLDGIAAAEKGSNVIPLTRPRKATVLDGTRVG
jgi:hypothetical protein